MAILQMALGGVQSTFSNGGPLVGHHVFYSAKLVGNFLTRTVATVPCRGPRSFATFCATRPAQHASGEREAKETHKQMKEAATEVKETAKDLRGKVNGVADQVIEKAIEGAGKVIGAAKEHGKTNDTLKGTWGSAKETMEKVKDAVTSTAEDAKEDIKGTAGSVKRVVIPKD